MSSFRVKISNNECLKTIIDLFSFLPFTEIKDSSPMEVICGRRVQPIEYVYPS